MSEVLLLCATVCIVIKKLKKEKKILFIFMNCLLEKTFVCVFVVVRLKADAFSIFKIHQCACKQHTHAQTV